uniref:Uncharacterized protein n=1 Tax=Arundo donax TaxID=35708 RepID=A0A0A9FGL9_ARUDO
MLLLPAKLYRKCVCHARPVPTTTGNTSMVRPMLRHTTHGTDSDRLIKPVSKEPGINPLRFQNSIQTAGQPALITSLTDLICATESDQLARGFSQQIELPLLCKPA